VEMRRTIAFAMLMLTAALPSIMLDGRVSAQGTADISLVGISFGDIDLGPRGEVPTGDIEVRADLSNNGTAFFIAEASVDMTIRYWTNGTTFAQISDDLVVIVEGGRTQDIRIGGCALSMGTYNVSVSFNFTGTVLSCWERVRVEDMIDLGILSGGMEEMVFRVGVEYHLPYRVEYQGNVRDMDAPQL